LDKFCGLANLAEQFELDINEYGNGKSYTFPEGKGNGWIYETNPEQGLFVSSCWFTPASTLTYLLNSDESGMLFISFDCGSIKIIQNGTKTKILTSRNHIFVNPLKPVKFLFDVNVHLCCTCLFISEEFLKDMYAKNFMNTFLSLKTIRKWKDNDYNTPDITLTMEQIKWEARYSDIDLNYYIYKVLELFSLIEHNISRHSRLQQDRSYHVSWDVKKKILLAVQQIHDNILNTPSVDELSKLTALSESKLHRCFKSEFGLSVKEYIHMEKMKKALLLLADDELSISSIALKCGYKSPGMFTKAFKEIYHITPSQYRKGYYL
jgi:AraC-like DNA-binding protein